MILFLVWAVLLYIFAPQDYSFTFCNILHLSFLLEAIYLVWKDRKNEKIGFNLLFSISFYFTNFVYPIFVYPFFPDFSLFSFPFDDSVISQSTALAFLAYSVYGLGYRVKPYRLSHEAFFQNNMGKSLPRIFILLSVCFFLLIISVGGLEYFQDRYIENNMSENVLFQYSYLLLIPIVMLTCVATFYTKMRTLFWGCFLCSFFIASVILLSGSRTFPLAVYVLLFMSLSIRMRFTTPVIISFIFVGFVLMAFIGGMRGEDMFNSLSSSHIEKEESIGWLDNASDLIINNRNLYVIYDFVQEHGITWGLSLLSTILAPIPMGQSVFVSLFHIPSYMMGSASVTTFWEFGSNPPLGLGTNVVGDTYLALGLPGTVVLFYALGYFICYVRKQTYQGHVVWGIVYLILTADAVYMCRSSFFGSARTIIWAVLAYYILNIIVRRSSRNYFYEKRLIDYSRF